MAQCPGCGMENSDGSKFCNECGYSFTGGGQTGRLDADTVLEGRYIVVKTLGRGGMGAVYLALDQRLNNTPAAIKEMSTRAVGGDLQAAIGAFKKEASILIGLRHPSLPIVRDFFARGEDRWYLVMDYVEGETLKETVDRRGKIPEAEVLDWGRQLAEILNYLHSQNPPIIFRDLKPSNIMLTPQGQIKLIDFGIARHFRQGGKADTIAYGSSGFAPPEQYGENQTDARADIYALGVTLHYLLTGIDPGKNPFVFEEPSKLVKVSPRLNNAIMKALELKAEDRPGSMEELLKSLPPGKNRPVLGAAIHTPAAIPIEEAKVRGKEITADIPVAVEAEPVQGKPSAAPVHQATGDETRTVFLDGNQQQDETLLLESAMQDDGTQAEATYHLKPETGSSKNNAGIAKTPTASASLHKKPAGKTRNILLTVCLAVALLAGGVYGFNYYQGKNEAPENAPSDRTISSTEPSVIPAVGENPDANDAQKSENKTETVSEATEQTEKQETSQKIVFTDAALEKAIREKINKPQGDVYVDEVQNIWGLICNYQGVKDLRTLSCLTNLQELYLTSNQISDISGLRGLNSLKLLSLTSNQISDLSPLRDMTNLQELYLNYNQVGDISALGALKNLKILYLNNNQITDLNALSTLTNLEVLFLFSNQISDISALSNLTNLKSLYLSDNPISDYSPVSSYYQNLNYEDFHL